MPKNRTPLDTKGYYRVMRVRPDCSLDEIRLAYAMAKQNATGPYLEKLEEAYETLKDDKKRAAYDAEGLQGVNYLQNPLTLTAAIVVLIVVFIFLWLPDIRLHGKSFQPGQQLSTASTRAPFGSVVRYDPSHTFPNGTRGPAYLVRLADSGIEQWFPAVDLQASCEQR